MIMKSNEISQLFRDIGNKAAGFGQGMERIQNSLQRFSNSEGRFTPSPTKIVRFVDKEGNNER